MGNENSVKVGIGVMIIKDGKVLLGKRKGAHASGVYALPGGHFEYMESIVESAKREVTEETGIEITNVRLLDLVNIKAYVPKHYIDIGLLADWKSGEPVVLEPEKCESWDWYDLDALPEPLFAGMDKHLEAYRGGNNFFDN